MNEEILKKLDNEFGCGQTEDVGFDDMLNIISDGIRGTSALDDYSEIVKSLWKIFRLGEESVRSVDHQDDSSDIEHVSVPQSILSVVKSDIKKNNTNNEFAMLTKISDAIKRICKKINKEINEKQNIKQEEVQKSDLCLNTINNNTNDTNDANDNIDSWDIQSGLEISEWS